jgi:hypothetical protein
MILKIVLWPGGYGRSKVGTGMRIFVFFAGHVTRRAGESVPGTDGLGMGWSHSLLDLSEESSFNLLRHHIAIWM